MKTFFIKIWIYEVHNKLPSMPNVWEQTKINFLRISVADITKEINFRKIINWELQILPQTYHKNKQQHQFQVVCAYKKHQNVDFSHLSKRVLWLKTKQLLYVANNVHLKSLVF